jgi:ribonuclease VapC
MGVVLDSSAILALLWKEPGAELVSGLVGTACMSSVNASEVVAKMVDRGFDDATSEQVILTLGVEIKAFDTETCVLAGKLRRQTRTLGLSLGDRACIALGIINEYRIVTADRAWSSFPGYADIEVIR